MKKLESPLIANRAKRELSALGSKQMYRIIDKAAVLNNTSIYDRNFYPIRDQIKRLCYSLIFDHDVTKEQLSTIQRQIKIVNNQLELPSIAS